MPCGRCALHFIGKHRARDRLAVGGRHVDADRIADAVLVNEITQRRQRHGVVVLEHRVQADDRQRLASEQLGHALRLRQRLRHAAGAQHLESVQQHHATAKVFEAERFVAVQPARCLPRRREVGRRHQKFPTFTQAQLNSVSCSRQGLTQAACILSTMCLKGASSFESSV